jgi:hypothetical protein
LQEPLLCWQEPTTCSYECLEESNPSPNCYCNVP